MGLTKRQIIQIEKFALGYYKKLDYAHNINHGQRAVKLAEYLARKERANIEICKLGALLHQFHNGKKVDEFLKKIKVNDNTRWQLVHCVECSASKNVHKARTVEAKVVYDADKLQVIGPSGLLREFWCDVTFRKMSFIEAVNHVQKIQEKIWNLLQTKTARKLAKDTHKSTLKFWKLFNEWYRLR